MRNDPEFLLIEGCNFIDFPAGGQLSFARQMMRAFGICLALGGIFNDDLIAGKKIRMDII